MITRSPLIKRLKIAASKAAARAAAAKTQMRAAKAQLKQARKLFKSEKKAAKQARRKVDAATISRAKRTPRPAATLKLKPAVRKPETKPVLALRERPKAVRKIAVKSLPKKTRPRRAAKARIEVPVMRSAAEVAKSVIERLHAPPPALPLAPVMPSDPPPSSADAPSVTGES